MFSRMVGEYGPRLFSLIWRPFPKRQSLDKNSLQTTIKSDANGREFSKRELGTENLLVTGNFSYSYSVFKRLVLQT